jgi:hypothetical protein
MMEEQGYMTKEDIYMAEEHGHITQWIKINKQYICLKYLLLKTILSPIFRSSRPFNKK